MSNYLFLNCSFASLCLNGSKRFIITQLIGRNCKIHCITKISILSRLEGLKRRLTDLVFLKRFLQLLHAGQEADVSADLKHSHTNQCICNLPNSGFYNCLSIMTQNGQCQSVPNFSNFGTFLGDEYIHV